MSSVRKARKNNMKTQWLYKVSAALMIVMLAVTALPVVSTQAKPQMATLVDTYNAAGTFTWVAPAGVTSITVQSWGGRRNS